MKIIIGFYIFVLISLLIYSYGFVDPNLTLSTSPLYQKFHRPLFELVFYNRSLSTIIFVLAVIMLFAFYFLFLWLIKQNKLNRKTFWWLIGLTAGILLFAFPAFSYDIFNYIFTAKVAYYYHENPYLVMPIEFIGDPNLMFTRAANKIALYGPSWITLSFIPHVFSFDNIIAAIFSFKIFTAAFYFGAVWVIWKLTKNLFSVVLFALNPVLIIETLISAHNDIVMMFFVLLAYYFVREKKIGWAIVAFLLSVLVKYSTIILAPIFIYLILKSIYQDKINWERIFAVSGWAMFVMILLTPLREEIYSWYVIWMLSFAVLIPKRTFLLSFVITLSFSVILRYVPVLYSGNYFGPTPIIKEIVTFVPMSMLVIFWIWKKSLFRKHCP